MFETTIENYDEEIEIEVFFDYDPYEPMTRHYPGCDEQVSIYEVKLTESGEEICLLPETLSEVESQILDWIHEEREYAKYGYMLD